MAKKQSIEKRAEEMLMAKTVKAKKPISYAQKIIIILTVTAIFVVSSVIIMSLFLTGVFDATVGNVKEDEKNATTIHDGFINYVFNSNKMPYGKYAEFVFVADGNEYKFEAYLFTEYAPNTVNNFISYVSNGFYSGTTLGEATLGYAEDGTPNSGRLVFGGYSLSEGGAVMHKIPKEESLPIVGEFLENGFNKNKLSHTDGVIGLVHGKSPNDGTTDFYILPYGDELYNGRYAGFAKITTQEGISIARRLAKLAYEGKKAITLKKITIRTQNA